MKRKIIEFIKKENILVISAILAIITMFFVPINKEYVDYMNPRVLCLLFSLMAVISGFQKTDFFKWLASALLRSSRSGMLLGFVLVMLPFFTSMLITNDVALITFVPFTIVVLRQLDCMQRAVPILIFQTIAANLGSMLTPIGSPHNLFLYTFYDLSAIQFVETLGLLTLISFIVLGICSLFLLPRKISNISIDETIKSKEKLIIYIVLFIFCILTVLNIIHYLVLTGIIILTFLLEDKSVLKEPDYGLLLTFICFFIVSGNLGHMEIVKHAAYEFLDYSTVLTSIATSQFISNVPASVLLSGFTDNWQGLLIGANIGGLGTPIASLASLITLKIYANTPKAKVCKFLLFFTVANLLMMLILLVATPYIIGN